MMIGHVRDLAAAAPLADARTDIAAIMTEPRQRFGSATFGVSARPATTVKAV
jgi:hypothetical protein